jgi:hypothetical protein
MDSVDQTTENALKIGLENNHSHQTTSLNNVAKRGTLVWDNSQQVGMQFSSVEDFDAAIDWLWTEPALRELPRVHVGRNTMIVPAESVAFFRKKGYNFTLSKVVSAGELAPEEIGLIRRTGGTRTK